MTNGKFDIWIDTNILIDVIKIREKNYEDSNLLLNMCAKQILNGYTCTLSICDSFYVARKTVHSIERKKILLALDNYFYVLPLQLSNLVKSAWGKFNDFEDGIQYELARQCNCDFIITNNIRDYKFSQIPAFTVKSFLALYNINVNSKLKPTQHKQLLNIK